MPIERPVWNPVAPPPEAAFKEEESYPSIGKFLDALKETYLDLLGRGIVRIDRNLQIVYGNFFKHRITDAVSVATIIDEIATEGEGRPTGPSGDLLDAAQLTAMFDANEVAHYYRFAEILYGKKLIEKPDGSYGYEGDLVAFPECYPVARIGKEGYGEKTRPFNLLYTRMLDLMDEAWANPGNGVEKLRSAVQIMRRDMKGPALDLMKEPLPDKPGNYGPDFRYLG